MEHPKSIVWFSRSYLAALALKIIANIMSWRTVNAGVLEIGLILALLLWFGVVYRRSNVARWLIVGLYLVSAVWGIFLLIALSDALSIVMLTAQLILSTVAVGMLIEGESDSWLRVRPE